MCVFLVLVFPCRSPHTRLMFTFVVDFFFFFSSRRRHTRFKCDWSSDVCSSDLDEQINTQDLYGNATTIPRFQCNLILKTRRTAADAIRGIRNGSRLYLTYGPGDRKSVV